MGCGRSKEVSVFLPLIEKKRDNKECIGSSVNSENSHAGNSIDNSFQLLEESIHRCSKEILSSVLNTSRSSASFIPRMSKEINKLLIQYSDAQQFLAQKEYKILLYATDTKLATQLFPSRITSENIQIENTSYSVTFSIYTTKAPVIVDCVLYIIESFEDFKEIYSVNLKFKHVWTQALIIQTEDHRVLEIADSLGIEIVSNTKKLFKKICSNDFKLFHLLKAVFSRIDTDRNGLVDINELAIAMKYVKEVEFEEIQEGFRKMDVDNDGKISFEEFVLWWKRGRQGSVSFSQIAIDWAKVMSLNRPDTRRLVSNLIIKSQIHKKSVKKEILLQCGKESTIKTEIFLDIGKSAFKEKILNEFNINLELFRQELWVCLKVTVDRSEDIIGCEEKIKKDAEDLLDSLCSSILDGIKLRKAIECSVKVIDSDVFILFIIELNEELESIERLLTTADEILNSPVNDYISIHIESPVTFSSILSEGDLLKNLGSSLKAKILTEYWSKFSLLISSLLTSHPTPLLQPLILSSGKSFFTFTSFSDLTNLLTPTLQSYSFTNSQYYPNLMNFLHLFTPFSIRSTELCLRLSNIGFRLKVISDSMFNISWNNPHKP